MKHTEPSLPTVIEHREPPQEIIAPLYALLHEAKWIWPQKQQYDNFNTYACFSKKLKLGAVPEALWAAISADQSYQLSINGQHVCRGPARGYQSSWPFDLVDLSPFLVVGENHIEARAYFPSESNFFYICQSGFPGFIFAAEWDGGRLLSDTEWMARIDTSYLRMTRKSSTQLFRQEHVDLRQVTASGPYIPGFGEWTEPRAHHSFIEPWPDMEYRGIPMLRETSTFNWKLIGYAEGKSVEDWQHTDDVVSIRHAEGLTHEPRSGEAPNLCAGGKGSLQFTSHLIDFGRVVYGALQVTAHNAAGGECIDILYSETINEDSLALDLILDGWNLIALGSRLRLKQGSCGHRFYHPYGFRYAIITVRNSIRPIDLTITLHKLGYPVTRHAHFQHDDQQLEAIWDSCAYTQEICSHDAFVDTPWREQAQWWGDARYQGQNLHWLMGDDKLYKRGIRIVGAQQTADGLTYGLAPSLAHGCVIPDFSLAWVLTVWEHYWHTGSTDVFKSEKKHIHKVLSYFRLHFDRERNLLRKDSRYWLFLDWAPVYRGAYPAILSFILLWAIQRMQILADLTEDHKWSNELIIWINELTKGLVSLRDGNELFRDGLKEDGSPVNLFSIHCQILAVITGLEKLDSEQSDCWLKKAILPGILDKDCLQVKTNLHWYSELFEVLAQHGHSEAVITCIKNVWGPMAEFGSTMERSDFQRGHHSWSHAWTAHPLVHLMKILGGIRQTSPGWKSATLSPTFIGQQCEVSVPTPFGNLEVAWKRKDEAIHIRCFVPKGLSLTSLTGINPEVLKSGEHRWRIPVASTNPCLLEKS